MAKIARGRKAKVYIHASAYTASGLIEVRRTKDITLTNEAKTATAEARDLEYDMNAQAGKTLELSFDRLIEVANDDATDIAALESSFDNGTDLWVVVTRDAKDVASGDALKFVGVVTNMSETFANGEFAGYSFVIKPSHPDNMPTRVTTPLA